MAVTDTGSSQRDSILDNALALMSAHGAAGMTMRQLARACGVQVAAIYHYFESKDALLTAVVEERQYGSRLEIPLVIDGADPADRLRQIFMIVWDGALEEEAVWRLILGEGIRGEEAVVPVGRDLLGLVELACTAWVRDFIPELDHPEAVASLIVGQLLAGFVMRMFREDTSSIGEEQAATLVRAVFP